MLKALGAAAVGAIAGGMLSTEEAEAAHGTLNATSDGLNPAIHGENTGGGIAVEGTASNGTGVVGRSAGTTGVLGEGAHTGVVAVSPNIGLIGRHTGSDPGHGVYGSSLNGFGVSGIITNDDDGNPGRGVGVRGISFGQYGVAVEAWSNDGIGIRTQGNPALQVSGSTEFSTVGRGTIPAGQDSVFVNTGPQGQPITRFSHVTVTLTGDPGQASSSPGSKPVVVWVERRPDRAPDELGFVVHLSRPVRFATPFTYLIVEPVLS